MIAHGIKIPIAVITMAVLLLLGACAGQPRRALESQSNPLVNFSGSWQLNYGLSEDLYEKIETLQRIAIANARLQTPPSHAGRRGPVIMVNNRPVNNLRAIISLGQMADVISRTTVLDIEQSDEGIEIARKDDFALTCSFYGARQCLSPMPLELNYAVGTTTSWFSG